MYRVIYNSNNSGGGWWVSEEGWKALEAAGWIVHWKTSNKFMEDKDYRGHDLDTCLDKITEYTEDASYLGAKARSAAIEVTTLEDAIASFESATGCCASDEGCNCCGPPHEFEYRDMDTGKEGYGSASVKETVFSWE